MEEGCTPSYPNVPQTYNLNSELIFLYAIAKCYIDVHSEKELIKQPYLAETFYEAMHLSVTKMKVFKGVSSVRE